MPMEKTKCALLDTDFISKLHITRKDDENRLIDRVLELQDYRFMCHEQITVELGRHNTSAKDWLKEKIDREIIQKFTDKQLIEELRQVYGKNAIPMYLHYLRNACNLFDSTFYGNYYAGLEQIRDISDDIFVTEIAKCDLAVGCDNNLGEIKTYTLQQVMQNREDIRVYVFYSDDRKARVGLAYGGGISSISALSAFYVLKERLGIEKEEAKVYFDSWMQYHQIKNQTSFRVHRATKEQQLMKMDGYEIFDRIYDGTVGVARDGDLLLRSL